jgi:uncharacterized membrane protein YgcG
MTSDQPGHGEEPDSWLRHAMQVVLRDLHESAPLVLTIIALDGEDLVQLTVSSRAPGRLYRRTINPEDIGGHGNHSGGGGPGGSSAGPPGGGSGGGGGGGGPG